jgi:hypothetical protein
MKRRSGRAPLTERRIRSDRTPVGIHIAAGMVVVTAALMVAARLSASWGSARLVPVVVVLLILSAWTVDPVAMATVAALAYLLVIGFLVNQFGVLSWHGRADAYRLVVVGLPVVVGLLAGAVGRRGPPLRVPAGWAIDIRRDPRALTFIHKEEFPGG